MPSRRFNLRIFTFCAVATLVGAAVPAAAAPPIIAADASRPSAIEITDTSTYVLNGQYGARRDVICVGFINHGTQTATKVGLSVALIDPTGTVTSVDVMYANGVFPVGVRSAFSGSRDQDVTNGNCHAIAGSAGLQSSTFTMKLNKNAPVTEIAGILLSAREIVYADGSAFRSDLVPKTGDVLPLPPAQTFALAVPNGAPLATRGNVAGSPVEMADAFAYEEVVRTGGGPAGPGLLGMIASLPVTTRGRSYCVKFANHDPRAVQHVRVDVLVLDRTGTIVGIEPIDAKGPFAQAAPGETSGSLCKALRGKNDADSFMFSRPDADAVATGRIMFSPVQVDFTDGTSWTDPILPVIGAPAALPVGA